jgi:hypothetical protein
MRLSRICPSGMQCRRLKKLPWFRDNLRRQDAPESAVTERRKHVANLRLRTGRLVILGEKTLVLSSCRSKHIDGFAGTDLLWSPTCDRSSCRTSGKQMSGKPIWH